MSLFKQRILSMALFVGKNEAQPSKVALEALE